MLIRVVFGIFLARVGEFLRVKQVFTVNRSIDPRHVPAVKKRGHAHGFLRLSRYCAHQCRACGGTAAHMWPPGVVTFLLWA